MSGKTLGRTNHMQLAFSATSIFMLEAIVAVVSFVACRFRATFAALFVPLAIWIGHGLLVDLYEPSIYDSIQVDLGGHAVGLHWAVAAILVVAPVAGAALRLRARKDPPANPRAA